MLSCFSSRSDTLLSSICAEHAITACNTGHHTSQPFTKPGREWWLSKLSTWLKQSCSLLVRTHENEAKGSTLIKLRKRPCRLSIKVERISRNRPFFPLKRRFSYSVAIAQGISLNKDWRNGYHTGKEPLTMVVHNPTPQTPNWPKRKLIEDCQFYSSLSLF